MSLYERLGGREALQPAVDEFYRRMLADPRVAPFFDAVDMDRQKAKQRAFLAWVMGGPPKYTGKTMAAAHEPLLERGLNDQHVDIVIQHLGETLADMGVGSADVQEVADLANSVRDDVLNRPRADDPGSPR